ncbi:MAG TPA: Ig-like domain-containing protein, partial [Planctomycetota bacterium]|nr:Ig-like domain-containing protein [Planctomycetota bacterium]
YSTLAWTTTNASSASLSPGIGPVPLSGSLTVSPASTTIYTLTATNSSGSSTASATVTVAAAADTTRPTVSITNPVNGAVVPRKSYVTITADASDNVGVVKVEFYVNGVLKGADTLAPYAHFWRVPRPRNTTYVLKAKAYDAAGNAAASNVTVTSSP